MGEWLRAKVVDTRSFRLRLVWGWKCVGFGSMLLVLLVAAAKVGVQVGAVTRSGVGAWGVTS